MESNRTLTDEQREKLLRKLKDRFVQNTARHKEIGWTAVSMRLEANHRKCWSLHEMERTGGEPDVVGYDAATDQFLFFDCSAESPAGRRSLCYDQEALLSRKEHLPKNNAIDVAAEMGLEILNEEQYRTLQQLGEFDQKTSSWLRTPADIRELGGAIFGDLRYRKVFVYHNGAQSYYAARGFRGLLWV